MSIASFIEEEDYRKKPVVKAEQDEEYPCDVEEDSDEEEELGETEEESEEPDVEEEEEKELEQVFPPINI